MDVVAEHDRVLAGLDPLLPETGPLPVEPPARLLSVTAGPSAGQALARYGEVGAEDPLAMWGALRRHMLTVRLAGPDRAGVLRELLHEWLGALDVRVGDWDTSASVTVPSRDPVVRLPLVELGFAPLIVVAARRAGTSTPAGSDVPVREAVVADLDQLADLNDALVDTDAHNGVVTSRPGQRERLREGLETTLAGAPGWTLVAGEPRAVGFVQVNRPEQAAWIVPMSSAGAEAAYLSGMYVEPKERGSGVGAALVGKAHARIDAAGVPLTLLHYAVPNPRSGPFWSRMGYRPLWTTWQRRPAARPEL
ncbi:GNAT family N-acetyltransferase [Nakamurella sp. YIM 132087]|uniref:GNAT family N-acetyltransferase n=1 Tax=Nakamurella alba TaxID=2665158 RepID=A0A7K1FMP4_9ACTN|nr:GNAT family N-acetyltransferase [Nakamurella alba]MTD15441.1 GNAT family N-acetyltransferase [Nakamurella alba]